MTLSSTRCAIVPVGGPPRADPPVALEALEALLGRALGADLVLWNDIDVTGRLRIEGGSAAAWRWLVPTADRLAPYNALRSWVSSGSTLRVPLRMSDLVPNRVFRSGPVYHELFVPMAVRFQLALPVARTATAVRVWTLNRQHHDFTDAEVAWAAQLQPSLTGLDDLRPGGIDAGPAPTGRLTRREQEVVTLLQQGWTAARIGHTLRISHRTVRKHLEHVYAKLGTHDRLLTAQLVGATTDEADQSGLRSTSPRAAQISPGTA